MKRIIGILLIVLTIGLTGCRISNEITTTQNIVVESRSYTYELQTTDNHSTILTDFGVGDYYRITTKNITLDSYANFYDEVNRVINRYTPYFELVKVPEYTEKVFLYNLNFEKINVDDLFRYPIDKEIKDEEFGGEKPVYILKEQLEPGIYDIQYRDYLKFAWRVIFFKNNEKINEYNPYEFNNLMINTYDDFDYIRIVNCSLVYRNTVIE